MMPRVPKKESSNRTACSRLFELKSAVRRISPEGALENDGHGQQNGMPFGFLTNSASTCNITMVRFEFGDTTVREAGELYRYTNLGPGIMVWGWYWISLSSPLVRIAGTLNSQRYISKVLEPVVRPYIQRLRSAIFQQDNVRPHRACNVQEFFTHQIELFS
ncbi:transposable element Tcb1 transposase [Trichonephila clavipes]|nr:transposable element Tcb1 transposase [Trichonephila clavipes]